MYNALIGTAINYEVAQIKNFVLSFRKYNKIDKLYLVTSLKRSRALENFFQNNNIDLIPFEGIEFIKTNLIVYRWIIYLEFLSLNKFNKIFLSDVRDVIFQGDPFNIEETEFLYFFQEDSSVRIKDCELNYSWCGSLLSKSVLESIENFPIICIGTIFGSYDRILDLLLTIKNELIEVKKQNICFEQFSFDQAVINLIVRKILDTSKFKIKNNGDLVGSIGHSIFHNKAEDIIKFEKNKIFVNSNCPQVIHQYTQYDELANAIDLIYTL